MKIHVFETLEDQEKGLQFLPHADPDTLYVFPAIESGSVFHSRNVSEPFEIAFLSLGYLTLSVTFMTPPHTMVKAPKRTAMAFEAVPGRFARWGVVPGKTALIQRDMEV
jgi:hypothetical protein